MLAVRVNLMRRLPPEVEGVLRDAEGTVRLNHGVPLSQFRLRLTQRTDDLFWCMSLTTRAAPFAGLDPG